MLSARVAVIRFPGSNCEFESLEAVERAGLDGRILRWNEDPEELARFDAYVLPGGFSYQDRIRGGAVAARLPLLEVISRRARAGAPVFGICNGAQILVEAGLVPGGDVPVQAAGASVSTGAPARRDASAASPTDARGSAPTDARRAAAADAGTDPVRLALAPNRIPGRKGYYTRWIYLVPGPGAEGCLFTRGLREPLPMPMAHAEGRFVTAESKLAERLALWTALCYARPDGSPAAGFPWNPNGSLGNAAGVSGLGGNVLALMPHPERARDLAQVPPDLEGPWGDRRRSARVAAWLSADGPGMALFHALARELRGGRP